jgi:mRNA-degrading endonuclease RelE of RelBE toxin-antitoxin system
MEEMIQIYEVIPTDKFNDDIKFYIKKKKFTRIIKDIEPILRELNNGIFNGDVIADLHLESNTYKIRSANSNTKEGKSNGYRLIYYVEELDKIVFLITIYYKKDDNRVPTDPEIVELIKKYCL